MVPNFSSLPGSLMQPASSRQAESIKNKDRMVGRIEKGLRKNPPVFAQTKGRRVKNEFTPV